MQTLIIVVLLVLFGFFAYYRLIGSAAFKRWTEAQFGANSAGAIYLQRACGMFFFAALPIAVLLLVDREVLQKPYFSGLGKAEVWYWILGIAAILIPLNFIGIKRPDSLAAYPQIRKPVWSLGILIFSALTWVGYLLAYEYLFRGLLFFSALDVMSLWPALILNIILYALVHVPKGKVETIGSLPLGLVLCLAAYHTGNIWVPFIAHVVLALSNEWIALAKNPAVSLRI